MTSIEFTVYSVPVAQPRQSQRIVKPKAGPAFVTNYMKRDAPVQEYKYQLKQTAREHMHGEPLWEGPLGMNIEIYLPRPKIMDGKKWPGGRVYHSGKKDIDNLFKSVADALTGIVYRDDGQICHVRIEKFYHERDKMPRVYVRIWKTE
jgi:Holliday junction resolvase RusA-like endonuclease